MTQATTFSNPSGSMALGDPDRVESPARAARAGGPAAPGPAVFPSLESLPDSVPETVRRAFAPVAGPEAAERYTRHLAHSHYENFSVVSLLLPRHLRQDFCNVYAFCRTADDLGDEVGDKAKSLDYLASFREQTLAMYAGRAQTAVFAALGATVRRYDIPAQPLLDLIDAFEQDQRVSRYESFGQVVDYCRRSADPVGRLVLYMCGYRDERRQRLSDKICTALQLANFWQDVRRDLLERDRIYLPAESMKRFGVDERAIRDGIAAGRGDENFRQLIRFEVERTEALFAGSKGLLPLLRPSVRRQIGLFAAGGLATLRAIRRQGYDTLAKRPSLSKWQKGRLVGAALAGAAVTNAGDWAAGLAGLARFTGGVTRPVARDETPAEAADAASGPRGARGTGE